MIREYSFKSGRTLTVGKRALVMGILNVTPDSFSDGNRFNTVERAVRHVREMISDGADIIDIGAESTRPDFTPISVDEELSRLEPVLRALADDCSVPISVDTYKPETARVAVELGADIINDVDGANAEPMIRLAAELNCPLVVGHNRRSTDKDIVEDVKIFFASCLDKADKLGVDKNNLILDPGIGFGKTPDENITLLRRLDELVGDYPLLLGVSRKSAIGHALGLPVEQRDIPTGVWSVIGVMRGADIVRVHNVKLISPMIRAADALRRS